jgi:DNA repair exonuclease SbcCD ATPase subunit
MNDVGEDRGCYLVNSEDWSVTFKKLDYPELKRLEKIEGKEETKFEERIKATSFQDILVEWLDREQKPQSYLDLIQKDITDKVQVAKNFFNGRITEIYLKDFMSIEEIKVEIKTGFWLVMGENGTGKTSFFEGIYWILFDCLSKTIAKPDVVKNRPTKQKEAIGELCLVDDKQVTKIIRSSKNGLEIWQDKRNLVDGMTKVQAQEFLEKHILGFDKNTYLASCYFSQEQLLTLAQLGDTDKANMITGLLGFETYDSLYQMMDLKKKEVTLQLDLLEQSSVKLDNDLWKNSEQQKNLKEQIEMFTKQQCSLKDEQLKVNQQIDEFTTLLGNIIVPSATTEEIDDLLLALNSSKTEMSIKLRKLQESGNIIIQEQNKIDKEKTKFETEKRLKLESISNHEAIISSLKENKCVYCGTILERSKLEEHKNKEIAAIAELKGSIYSWEVDDLNKQLEKLYDQEAENKELIDATNAEIINFEKQIRECQEQKLTAIKEQTEAHNQKVSLTSQIKQLGQRKVTLVNQLAQVNVDDKLTQLKELGTSFDNLDAQKLDIADKKVRLVEHLDIYTFWHNSFGSKGIRPLLLDKFVNSFNDIIKHFCYEVSNGEFIVQFSPTSTTRAGLERNKLGLEIVYKDKIVSYASLSGGEKTRVALPLCFGLNKWISSKYGIKNGLLGIIVLDEMFSHTDEKFRESVSHMLYNEGQNRVIFVIDHSDILAGYTNQVWNVTKENDTTQLQIT